ncbi:hypothetical protein RF11_06601 [Thelohanellus kitauei]|uniref:Uncharacterized protein n=1 Tax=Thelohanellus kitauei TaxID=669202 RepID=A0A0C2J6A9_THEKT|nr:hypothetical protein RF11_06601 [Thelohanellus kitauei]
MYQPKDDTNTATPMTDHIERQLTLEIPYNGQDLDPIGSISKTNDENDIMPQTTTEPSSQVDTHPSTKFGHGKNSEISEPTLNLDETNENATIQDSNEEPTEISGNRLNLDETNENATTEDSNEEPTEILDGLDTLQSAADKLPGGKYMSYLDSTAHSSASSQGGSVTGDTNDPMTVRTEIKNYRFTLNKLCL